MGDTLCQLPTPKVKEYFIISVSGDHALMTSNEVVVILRPRESSCLMYLINRTNLMEN